MASNTSTLENGTSDGTNGKTAVGFRPQNHGNSGLVKVQPPKREDLQPSYAQTLFGDEGQETNGWYGSMSTFPPLKAMAHSPSLAC